MLCDRVSKTKYSGFRRIFALVVKGVIVLNALSASGCQAEIRKPDTIPNLASLAQTHPRLLATSADFLALRERTRTDKRLTQWHQAFRDAAEKVLSEPPAAAQKGDGDFLALSRTVRFRADLLALMYRLDDDPRYARRLGEELFSAAALPDWHPAHFLDTAEMLSACALGYDWLFDVWTPDERAILRRAIVEKGLMPARRAYRGEDPDGWWVNCDINWNQVCHGGIILGVLAIADEEPDLARELLPTALANLPLAMKHFAPDGGWPEGVIYWNYATLFNVIALAALDTALPGSGTFADLPGFSETGLFPLYMCGPTNKVFNFADCPERNVAAPQLYWLAYRFDRPECFRYETRRAPDPLGFLWLDPNLEQKTPAALPLDRCFRHASVATMRSAWDDPSAVFVGFKWGDNSVNHSHLDLGSFVLDALGERWALDLGPDNYGLPGYFGASPLRWTYYRLRAEGHNTLCLNPTQEPDQSPVAEARLERFQSAANRASAIVDLTPAYKQTASRVRRGIALAEGRRAVFIQDEISLLKPGEIYWFMHTKAEIRLEDNGKTAVLTQGDAHLFAQILSPSDARFSVEKAEPLPQSPNPSGQRSNEGVRKLVVCRKNVTDLTLTIRLTPSTETETPPVATNSIIPLDRW